MSNLNTVRDESLKYYSMVTKLVRYTSKFGYNDDGRPSKRHSSTRNDRLLSNLDVTDKSSERRRFRLAPIWPEWNEAEINVELWDTGNIKKKDTTSVRARADTKTNIPTTPHAFEDPEGKIELPPSFKIEQWKRPIDFLPSDKPPVIVDPDLGIQNFDLITSNEHLHHSEIMRNIISQITVLWDICRKERKTTKTSLANINQFNINERTWRPWEHIYALNKVFKQPFISPYNPAGKYVVRLFFLGTWRKIIIDDSIPFDSNNRCLLPQTTLAYELWPILLSKALLKIISLDFNPSYSETSVIHLLTGWIPEPIPLKYTHAEKIWNFLRYDRSNKHASENELHSKSSSGPIPVFRWSDSKLNRPEETILLNGNDQLDHLDNNMTKKLDDKHSKKGGGAAVVHPAVSKDSTVIKSSNIKENRTIIGPHVTAVKDVKKTSGINRGGLTEDIGVFSNDQMTFEAPKMIIFATISHLQPTRMSSFSETADKSALLRHYNLNNTFSTAVLLTSIRDIPLESPPTSSPSEFIPAWKLIRPRKPKILPHAEPIIPHETKRERWIEISSPYINYPTENALNIKPTIRSHSIDNNNPPTNTPSCLNRSVKHSEILDPLKIIEMDEDEDFENVKIKLQFNTEIVRSTTSLSLPITRKESNVFDTHEKSYESRRSAGSKYKRQMSFDKTKIHRKSFGSVRKVSSDIVSIKSKAGESEQIPIPIDMQTIGNNNERKSSQLTNLNLFKKPNLTPKIWMDFDDFCTCFTSIIIFHNPHGYQYTHKHTEIKFTPYQPPVPVPVTKEKKKESNQPIVQPIPILQDDKSSLYLFVDSTRETLEKNIELIISLTCLPRWYDALTNETIRGLNTSTEKLSIDHNLTKTIISQKEILPQSGSLMVEIYSWKSLSIGQPILRLHTTATKAALLTLPPGRHVLKFLNTCAFAFNLQILSDTNDFMLGDEEQLLNKIISVPEDAEFILQAEELFFALDNSIQNFHLINQQENKLNELFRLYCQHAPISINLNMQICLNAFNQALYSTLRTILNTSGSVINPEIQFAWRCFTNDLFTPDILGVYETKRLSVTSASRHSARAVGGSSGSTGGTTISKKSSGGKDKSSDDKTSSKQQPLLPNSSSISDLQEDPVSDWLTRELNIDEIDDIISIQKVIRGFLQRRIDLARKADTEKNVIIRQTLQSTMSLLEIDSNKSALLLFKNFISIKPQLIQCFSFRNDDWNMVTYRDYNGLYQEQSANTWFVLFREIFYITEECLILAKFFSYLPNSLLRIINNDTYEEMPLVFNRLAPGILTKNKYGYTFFAEGISLDQSILNTRFRLRLITSYTQLPEIGVDQITSSFFTKEIIDYYLPNKEEIICRYRVIVNDDINQTGRNFHLASIHFSTSKSDVFMRLTIFDNNEEIVSIEGKGSLVLPAILFMRTVTNIVQTQSSSRPTSKTGGTRKKDASSTRRGSIGDLTAMNKDRIGSGKRSRRNSRTVLMPVDENENEKSHKYIIQVTLLRKTWPLTLTQWQFIEQLKEQEKNELKIFNPQLSPTKLDRPSNKRPEQTTINPPLTTTGKGKNSSVRGTTISSGRSSTSKENTTIDTSKPHWILRVVSDADKADELIIKKDTERNEELINMKKAWETFETGRAEKAMQTRQKFLDSLQIKFDDQPSPEITDEIINLSESLTDTETIERIVPSIIEQQQVGKQILSRKKSPSSIKKGSVKDETSKQMEFIPPQLQIDEPLLDEPPPSSKSKIFLPPLDIKPFIKRKLSSNESIISDSLFEQDDFEYRQNNFTNYSKYINKIRQYREEDYNNRSKEKLHQLEEYINLQAKIDQIRRMINEPREAFRQRFLQIERQRLEELSFQQQKLPEDEKSTAVMIHKSMKKKTSAGKKKKT